jgi:hypothetical protein
MLFLVNLIHNEAGNSTFTTPVPYPLVTTVQRIRQRPSPCVKHHSMTLYNGEQLLGSRQTLSPEYHSLSAVGRCLLYSQKSFKSVGRLHIPQSEDTSCGGAIRHSKILLNCVNIHVRHLKCTRKEPNSYHDRAVVLVFLDFLRYLYTPDRWLNKSTVDLRAVVAKRILCPCQELKYCLPNIRLLLHWFVCAYVVDSFTLIKLRPHHSVFMF